MGLLTAATLVPYAFYAEAYSRKIEKYRGKEKGLHIEHGERKELCLR
jgi:hypothetical protein